MIDVLFVGGPRDGEQQRVPAGVRLPDMIRAEEPELTEVHTFSSLVPETLVSLRTTHYRLGWFTLNGEDRVAVYVAEGTSPYEAANAVLERMTAEAAGRAAGWALIGPPAEPTRIVLHTTASPEVVHSPDPMVFVGPEPESVPAPLLWRTCKGREKDPHEEVRWQGGVECWVCGQPGGPAGQPTIKDQAVAPYGWD